MEFTLTFLEVFLVVVRLASPLLIFLLAIIIICGQFAGHKEGWKPMSTLYWTFITATTVGYGDMPPTHKRSRILAVVIAFIGLMLTGILVAVTLNAATHAFDNHVDAEEARQMIEDHLD